MGGCHGDGVVGIGVDGAHQGQQLKTDLVAGVIGFKVGAVGDVGLVFLMEPILNLLTGYAQQRADDVAVAGFDAGQSFDSGAADEV